MRKEKRLLIRENNTSFAVLHADGLLKAILNSLKMTHKVQILTTPACGNCSAVERMLDDLKIPYEIIDVTEKPEYLEKYPIFTAPCVVIDDKLEFTGVPKKQELAEKLKI